MVDNSTLMSKDKKKLHKRAMALITKIGPAGIGYCNEGGIGPSKELSYLIKHGMAKIQTVRYKGRHNHFVHYSKVQLTEKDNG